MYEGRTGHAAETCSTQGEGGYERVRKEFDISVVHSSTHPVDTYSRQ